MALPSIMPADDSQVDVNRCSRSVPSLGVCFGHHWSMTRHNTAGRNSNGATIGRGEQPQREPPGPADIRFLLQPEGPGRQHPYTARISTTRATPAGWRRGTTAADLMDAFFPEDRHAHAKCQDRIDDEQAAITPVTPHNAASGTHTAAMATTPRTAFRNAVARNASKPAKVTSIAANVAKKISTRRE